MDEEKRMNVLALIPIEAKDRIGMEDVPYTPHAGSGRIPCEKCGVGCWIGPRQTTMKVNNPHVPALCVICVVRECQNQKETGEEVTASVISLAWER